MNAAEAAPEKMVLIAVQKFSKLSPELILLNKVN
jgi:hypothetical protein